MHRHTEEVLYLLCFRSEGSSANQCSGSEGKITSQNYALAQLPHYRFHCVSKAKIVFTVFSEAQSSKVWLKLELESSGHAKPRAGAPFWSKTLSGSSDLEPNLSGSSVLEQNLEREL